MTSVICFLIRSRRDTSSVKSSCFFFFFFFLTPSCVSTPGPGNYGGIALIQRPEAFGTLRYTGSKNRPVSSIR